MTAVALSGAAAANNMTAVGDLLVGTNAILNYTCAVGTDCLVVVETNQTGGLLTPPMSVTYMGYPLTYVPASSASHVYAIECSIWYLLKPPTNVAGQVLISYNIAVSEGVLAAQGLKGVNQANPVGVANTATIGSGTSPNVTAVGATSNGIYLGILIVTVTADTITGVNQTHLTSTISRGSIIASFDTIPGSSPGAFSWTVAAGTCTAASAVAFLPFIPQPIKFYANGTITSNNFIEDGTPLGGNLLMKAYANGNVQSQSINETGAGPMKFFANGQIQCNSFIEVS